MANPFQSKAGLKIRVNPEFCKDHRQYVANRDSVPLCHTTAIEMTRLRHLVLSKFAHNHTMEMKMEHNNHVAGDLGRPQSTPGSRRAYEFEQQCLRVLRCTAQALANSPGGLRFQAGTRPWLDALKDCRSDLSLSQPAGV
jgi:hypothetical protein